MVTLEFSQLLGSNQRILVWVNLLCLFLVYFLIYFLPPALLGLYYSSWYQWTAIVYSVPLLELWTPQGYGLYFIIIFILGEGFTSEWPFDNCNNNSILLLDFFCVRLYISTLCKWSHLIFRVINVRCYTMHIYLWGNWDLDSFGNLCKVPQMVSGGVYLGSLDPERVFTHHASRTLLKLR
jgi:hypothetical protein